MALINFTKIEHVEKAHNHMHAEASASYTVFELNDHKFFQIDSYGSSERTTPGKLSQSIQFDEASANALIKLLEQHFSVH